MNHLESSFAGKNSFWRYIVMIAAVFLASNTIGALPLLGGLLLKSIGDPGLFSALASNPGDYSAMGFPSNIFLIIMLFPFIVGLAAFWLLMKPLHSRTFSSVINGTGKVRWSRLFIAFAVWTILSALYLIAYLRLDPENFSINNQGATLIVLVIISLALIPFQAAFEEIIFRGYLMQGFAVLLRNRWLPVIFTSLLFSLMHGLNPEVREYGFLNMMPQYFLFAMIFGIITILDDGVEAAIGAHAANNVFLCIMVTNKSSALQTAAYYKQLGIHPWIEFAALLAVGLLFVLILKVIFRWKDFSVVAGKVMKPALSETVN